MMKFFDEKNKVAFLFFVFCLGMGCPASQHSLQKTKTSQKISSKSVVDFFPLRVGDRRIYRVWSFLEKKASQHEFRIVRKVGKVWQDNSQPIAETYQYDPWGLQGKDRYLLQYPLKVGTKWISILAFRVERYEIISTSQKVRVPAGIYSDCIVVRSREQQRNGLILEATFHYAPQVGLVLVKTQILQGSQIIPQWKLELETYQEGPSTSPKKK